MGTLIPKEVFQNKLAEKYQKAIKVTAPIGAVALSTPILDALMESPAERKRKQDEQRKKDNKSALRSHRLRS